MLEDIEQRIIRFSPDDLNWPFTGNPFFRTRPRTELAYSSQIAVDPFPCYLHDHRLVKEVAEKVESLFPVSILPNYYLLPNEPLDRCNGFTSSDRAWKADNSSINEPFISLNGKRIPPHPAMTRYLVAHEYGHVVRYHIENDRGLKHSSNDLYDEYSKIRNIKNKPSNYGGLTWHITTGEIFANDFRILICGIEPEFWPHPEPYPTEIPSIQEFWKNEKKKVSKT